MNSTRQKSMIAFFVVVVLALLIVPTHGYAEASAMTPDASNHDLVLTREDTHEPEFQELRAIFRTVTDESEPVNGVEFRFVHNQGNEAKHPTHYGTSDEYGWVVSSEAKSQGNYLPELVSVPAGYRFVERNFDLVKYRSGPATNYYLNNRLLTEPPVYVFEEVDQFELTLDPAGGTFAEGVETSWTINEGEVVVVPSIEELGLTREGYVFVGWREEGNETVYGADGEVFNYNVNADTILTAVWEQEPEDVVTARIRVVDDYTNEGIPGYKFRYEERTSAGMPDTYGEVFTDEDGWAEFSFIRSTLTKVLIHQVGGTAWNYGRGTIGTLYGVLEDGELVRETQRTPIDGMVFRRYQATTHTLFEKIDENGDPLSGAKFRIWNEDETINLENRTSSSAGKVTAFLPGGYYYDKETSIPIGKYSIQETEAPAGYEPDPTVYELHISAEETENGTVDIITTTMPLNEQGQFVNQPEQVEVTLTLDPADGTFPEGVETSWTVNEGKVVVVPSIEELGLTREGYDFIGWSEEGNDRLYGRDGATFEYTVNADTTLIAVWEEIPVPLVFEFQAVDQFGNPAVGISFSITGDTRVNPGAPVIDTAISDENGWVRFEFFDEENLPGERLIRVTGLGQEGGPLYRLAPAPEGGSQKYVQITSNGDYWVTENRVVLEDLKWQFNLEDPEPPIGEPVRIGYDANGGRFRRGAQTEIDTVTGVITLATRSELGAANPGHIFLGWRVRGTDEILPEGSEYTLTGPVVFEAVWQKI